MCIRDSNRIKDMEEETDLEDNKLAPSSIDTQPTQSASVKSLEETAATLGIEADFLAEKGLNAILRMIARNGGKLTFPLEVEQID